MSDVAGSHRIEIDAPIGACAAVLADVERYPDWYDTIDVVRVLERDRDGRPALAACAADAGPLGAVEFTLRLAHDPPRRLVGAQVAGNGRVEAVRMEWTLEPLAGGGTQASYAFRADARSWATRVALRAARPLVERDLIRAPAHALKRRVEAP